jgi:hypothetical protein
MLIQYIEKRFAATSLKIIEQANVIIEEYAGQGYSLTLRQLYYQFVARGLVENTQQSYKRLGTIIAAGRNAGLIDWDAIEDRTRELRSNAHWDSPADIVQSCAKQFRYDLWADQAHRIEVWIEKDALLGVFDRVCTRLDVPLFSCRGYTSQSEVWSAGRRMLCHAHGNQVPVVLHFGDHDPSGIDMTRDIAERLSMYGERPINVTRLALNRDQVEEYGPPPNPAKMTDSRYGTYVAIHGDESWELDAMSPEVLAELVERHVQEYRDDFLWEQAVERQQEARERLLALAKEL